MRNTRWVVAIDGAEPPDAEQLATKAVDQVVADASLLGDNIHVEHNGRRYHALVTNSVPAIGVFPDGGILCYLEVRASKLPAP